MLYNIGCFAELLAVLVFVFVGDLESLVCHFESTFSTLQVSYSLTFKASVRYKPDAIKGDMDSIRTEVLDFYANLVSLSIYIFSCFLFANLHVMEKIISKLKFLVHTKSPLLSFYVTASI